VITLKVAWALTSRELGTDNEHALGLVDKAKEQLQDSKLTTEECDRLKDWTDLVRACALSQLARVSIGDGLKEMESLLQRLLDSPTVGNLAHEELGRLRLRENRLEDAKEISDRGLKKWSQETGLYGIALNARLAAGEREKVIQIASQAHEKVKRDRQGKVSEETSGFAFVAALGLLMTKAENWEFTAREFLATRHRYVPYIAMMLSTRMTGKGQKEAREVIESHWARARSHTWQARLREEDETVWREMLIGYYVGKVRREEIFDYLEDEKRFAASELRHVPMPRVGMLCEAYFYDALLAEASGNLGRMRASLEKVLSTNLPEYFEYAMAKFLLSQQTG
jgi:hypothetical protein